MDMKRQAISGDISERRRADAGLYPLEEAIADAVRYNGACSAVEGMSHIKHVIAQPVGLIEAQRVIAEAADAQALVSILAKPLAEQNRELEEWGRVRETRNKNLSSKVPPSRDAGAAAVLGGGIKRAGGHRHGTG
jgi:hypothetical protein